MQNKTISFCYTVKPISYEKINDNFTKMRCYVMAIGKNRNFSHISMDAVQQALPSFYNIPVVGHLKKADDGTYYIGGHDRQIVIDNDGIVVNDLTVPFGIVPETNNIEFVEVEEKDGGKATYMVADIILWTGRYGEVMDAVYSDEVYFGQSMEINPIEVEDLQEDKNYTDIKKFEFSALCLLGMSDDENKHVEPAFPSARVEPYSYNIDKDNFQNEFAVMMSQLKELVFSIQRKEGGNLNMDEKLKLLEKFNLTVEMIDFEIEDLSLEDLQIKIDEFVEKQKQDFSVTYLQKREALQNALDPIVVKDEDGNIVQQTNYWVSDFDDEFVFVEKYFWSSADNEVTHGRFTYSFDDKEIKATITGEFEEMVLVWLTKEENQKIQDEKKKSEEDFTSLQSDFDTYKAEYKTAETEVEELREFKSTKLSEERDNAETEIFSNFEEKLANVEEFKALKENCSELSLEDIEKECYAILGRQNFTFSKQTKKENKTPKLPIHTPTHDELLYGGIFAQYGKSNK